jgi:lysophospholipase L1-like esterase
MARIVFLGDSLTWGGFGGDFVAEVARLLPNHTIVNAGQGGNTVLNLLRRSGAVIESRPDVVFVMVGGNDAISALYPATRPYYRQVQGIDGDGVDLQRFAAAYQRLIAEYSLAAIPLIIGLPPVERDRALVDALGSYNEAVAALAARHAIPVVDLYASFLLQDIPERPPITLADIQLIGQRIAQGWDDFENERQRHGYRFTFDGLHPMPDAARQMAEAIVPTLRELL